MVAGYHAVTGRTYTQVVIGRFRGAGPRNMGFLLPFRAGFARYLVCVHVTVIQIRRAPIQDHEHIPYVPVVSQRISQHAIRQK